MNKPDLTAVSYGEPDIEKLEDVFYNTLFQRMSELKKGEGEVYNDMSFYAESVNETIPAVKGIQMKPEM